MGMVESCCGCGVRRFRRKEADIFVQEFLEDFDDYAKKYWIDVSALISKHRKMLEEELRKIKSRYPDRLKEMCLRMKDCYDDSTRKLSDAVRDDLI